MDLKVKDNKWFILREEKEENKLKINIYQIFTRLFGNKKSVNKRYGTIEENGVGKFNDITETALASLKDMGITHIWYTGIIEHAVLTDYTTYNIPLDDADVVKGRAGSPYAIKDYYDVNPDLAEDVNRRMHEFEELVKRTHQQKLKVIIDFVPNHVARSYKSDAKPEGIKDLGEGDDVTIGFAPENNFYYLIGHSFQVPQNYNSLEDQFIITKDHIFKEYPAKATGNNIFSHQPSIDDWFETVKLNYGVDFENNINYFHPIPSTWVKMRDILMYWAGKKIDGFRCDMAEMVPVEFWKWVIPQIKAFNPQIIFIAEIYNPHQYHTYLYEGKFDFLYDKVQLYDTLRNIITNNYSTDKITEVWQFLRGINKNMLRFLENHDEQRIASPFFAGDPYKAVPAMVVSSLLYTGPVMVYFGQEVGESGKGNSGFSGEDGRTTIFDYWGVPEHQKWMNNGKFDGGLLSNEQKKLRNFYKDLLNIRLKHPALLGGDFLDLHTFNQNSLRKDYPDTIYSFLRFTSNECLLIVANFDKEPAAVSIIFNDEIISILPFELHKSNNFELILAFPSMPSQTLTGKLKDGKFILELNCDSYSASVFRFSPIN